MAYLSPAFFIFRIGPRSGVGTGEATNHDTLTTESSPISDFSGLVAFCYGQNTI